MRGGGSLVWLALGILLLLPGVAQSASGPSVVLPAEIDARLHPIAMGLGDWVETQLAIAGVVIEAGAHVRERVRTLRSDARPPTTQALLDLARELESDRAVLIDVAFETGRIEVRLRVFDVQGRKLEGTGRAAGAPLKLAELTHDAIDSALPLLGIATSGTAPREKTPFDIGHLAARGRALAKLDAGRFASAWAELARDDTQPAANLRARIREAVRAPGVDVPREERARLMAAQDDAEEAWKEILRDASEQLYAEKPDPEMLLAAGEIQLARGKLHEAEAYLKRCIEVSPTRVDAHIGLALALANQQNEAEARAVFRRAIELEPSSPRAIVLMADMAGQDEKAKAEAHLEAARAHGRDVDPVSAWQHLDQAIALDPERAAEAREAAGALQLVYGEPRDAVQSFEAAIAAGGDTLTRQLGRARALYALREMEAAEKAYLAALALAPQDREVLLGLGRLLNESNRHAEARERLEQARAVSVGDPAIQLALARALLKLAEVDAALSLLSQIAPSSPEATEAARLIASLELERGNATAAEVALESAVQRSPSAVVPRQELAALYRGLGKTELADRQDDLIARLGGIRKVQRARAERTLEDETARGEEQPFDALVVSFGLPPAGADRTLLLGVREQLDWKGALLSWLAPRRLDLAAIESALEHSIDPHYERVGRLPLDGYTRSLANDLMRFESNASTHADSIATLNQNLRLDSVFVAQVQRGDWLTSGLCPEGAIHVELRRLSGTHAASVASVSNTSCVQGVVEQLECWNLRAAAVYAGLLLVVLLPLLRGYGTVAVRVKLPEQSRPDLRVALRRAPRPAGPSDAASNRMDRHTRKLEAGRDVIFTWVPARRRAYHIHIDGKLEQVEKHRGAGDVRGEESVVVARGRTSSVEFDLRPAAARSAAGPRLSERSAGRSESMPRSPAPATGAREPAPRRTRPDQPPPATMEHRPQAATTPTRGGDTRPAGRAETQREAGDLLSAALAYEEDGDYENAIACHRELGVSEHLVDLLEKNGQFFEAGSLCLELEDPSRALILLENVASDHPRFPEASRLAAGILVDEGESLRALEKFDLAARAEGLEVFSMEAQEQYAVLLEDAGRLEEAVAALEHASREDTSYRNVVTRIEHLRAQLVRQTTGLAAETDASETFDSTPEAAPARASAAAGANARSERYKLGAKIGSDELGILHKAVDRETGEPVVVRLMLPQLCENPVAEEYFSRDVGTALGLRHPNLSALLDTGRLDEQWFVSTEPMSGTPLAKVLERQGALPPVIVAQLGVQAATGLHFLHRRQIIHRDLQPSRLFLTKDKILKIQRVGLGRVAEELRRVGAIVAGTSAYAAPEIDAGREITASADLYSLGMILYELATGALPPSSAPERDPREANAKIPPAVAKLLVSMIARDPDRRVERAAEVVRVLQGLLDAAQKRRADRAGGGDSGS